MRHDKHNRNCEVLPGIGEALAVIAARCTHDAFHLGPVAPETIYVIDSAPYLEGADGSVVLVLDYDFDSEAPLEERPSVLRGWRHDRTYYGRRALKIV